MTILDQRLQAFAVAIGSKFDEIDSEIAGLSGTVAPQQFGALADGTTDDSAAFVAALAYLKSLAGNLSINGFYKGSPKLFIPAGHYYLGTTTLDITHTLVIEGEGSGRFFGAATRLRWAAGATGIRTQRYDTSGASTVDGTTHFGGDGTTLTRLKLEGGYAATEGEFHGLHAKTRTFVDDVWIYGFQGDGIHGDAHIGSGGADEGDCSNSAVTTVRIEACRRGIFWKGVDSNVIDLTRLDLVGNRQAGGWIDSGIIGPIVFRTCHAAANGVAQTGLIPTQCSYSSNRYAVVIGQETGASTNAPSGTTADNTWWLYIGAGAADTSQSIIAWTTGLTWRAGGAYVVNNSTAVVAFDECYQEDGQFSQFGDATLITGGAISETYRRGGARLRATSGSVQVDDDAKVIGSLAVQGGASGFGVSTADGATTHFGISNYQLTFVTNGTTSADVFGFDGVGMILKGYPTILLRYGPTNTTIATISSTAVDIAAGKVLSINGTTVLSGQMSHTADLTVAPTAADFNALLAKLQGVGLMA